MIGMWTQAVIGLVIGFIPGLLLISILASPFTPGLWKLSEPLARVLLTVSQFVRGDGVLVKRKSGKYEIGTYNSDESVVYVDGAKIPVDSDNINWGLFGKRRFGMTWEPGTEFHELIRGDNEGTINMAAAHRFLRGSNNSDSIDRTKEHAAAEYGGGESEMSDIVMAGLIILMLILGSGTAYLTL